MIIIIIIIIIKATTTGQEAYFITIHSSSTTQNKNRVKKSRYDNQQNNKNKKKSVHWKSRSKQCFKKLVKTKKTEPSHHIINNNIKKEGIVKIKPILIFYFLHFFYLRLFTILKQYKWAIKLCT